MMIVIIAGIQSTCVLDELQSGLEVKQPCSGTHSCPRHQDPDPDLPEVRDVAQGGEKESAFWTGAVSGPLNMYNDIASSVIAIHKLTFLDCNANGYIK